jgi:hypothetical protein
MRVPYETLPDDARAWVFASSRSLDPAEATALCDRVDTFLNGWNAHGDPLSSGREWIHDRFLVVAVDERSAPPSGCSIDALLGVLKGLESQLGARLTDHGDVVYRTPDGAITQVDRPTFARLAREGVVDVDTSVFDTTLTRKADVASRLEVPAREAWHRRAFWRRLRV